MELSPDAFEMVTALAHWAQAGGEIDWDDLMSTKPEEPVVEDDAPPGVETTAIVPKMASTSWWEQEIAHDAANATAMAITLQRTQPAKQETSAICVEKVLSVALANAAAHHGRLSGRRRFLEPARSEPMPQQKPRKERRREKSEPTAAFEAFEASESQTKPTENSLAEAISVAQSLPIVTDDSKEGNGENENDCPNRRRGDLPPGRSESPSPFRCRPAGYRQKRRAVASAVAMAIHGLKMAKQRQAERISLVA